MLNSEKSKYEILITVMKDNKFLIGDRIVSDNIVNLNMQLDFATRSIKRKLEGKVEI